MNPKIRHKIREFLKTEKTPASNFPLQISPQLATLTSQVPMGGNWLHETKFDGYRIITRIQGSVVQLFTRRGFDWSSKFSSIAKALKSARLPNIYLDGEVIALDDNGKPSFQELQNILENRSDQNLLYYIFDCMYFDRWDLRPLPQLSRKFVVQLLFQSIHSPALRLSEHIMGDGTDYYATACRLKLEGMISKSADAPYRSTRTKVWLKSKCIGREEFVIGGYTLRRNDRNELGALLLGVFDRNGQLQYRGKVGTGFSTREREHLLQILVQLKLPHSAFSSTRNMPLSKVIWVKPILVAEINFTEKTSGKRLRHPSFVGLRHDKNSLDVHEEVTL